ncbi:3-deoxy-7-phosphoheptulonate synthase [Microbulbifer litoralis]|uniref:3-deoxy-7-phosphoheptulonate synthase n=1 Tax=Microbulbifer litoralis TaxID=2933965 RepID=UPI0020282D02|nr:3-deoxy-7-phosphoheptulonate synthase [Microbulbifer sp. GX H0434]
MSISKKLQKSVNIYSPERILSPQSICDAYPLGREEAAFIESSRRTVRRIIHREDPRLLAIVGPCSIHDIAGAQEYACKLKELHEQYKDSLYILMRTYFEKPRTTVGWKGFINDPDLNRSFEIQKGICKARELLLFMAGLELPCATEILDPITSRYLGDLTSWVAIGARTTESQVHREMASDLSVPVGFKNGTDGNIRIAANAMKSAASSHSFLRVDDDGLISIIKSQGNSDSHLILRGGTKPNYFKECVSESEKILLDSGVNCSVVIDCSHGNAKPDYKNQLQVIESVGRQVKFGGNSISGVMLESHLYEGKQSVNVGTLENLKYGVSITDPCIGWDDTREALKNLGKDVLQSFESRLNHKSFADVVCS